MAFGKKKAAAKRAPAKKQTVQAAKPQTPAAPKKASDEPGYVRIQDRPYVGKHERRALERGVPSKKG